MLFRIKNYFQFIVRSTNQHGVHSPFVYNLVTKCFYDRKKRKSYTTIKKSCKETNISFKTAILIHRLLIYLNIKNVSILEDTNNIKKLIGIDTSLEVHTNITDSTTKFDLFFFDWNLTQPNYNFLDQIKDNIHNDSLILIKGIYKSNKQTDTWNTIIQNPLVSVSIDTYKLGFIFFRKEQVKEHFTIRV